MTHRMIRTGSWIAAALAIAFCFCTDVATAAAAPLLAQQENFAKELTPEQAKGMMAALAALGMFLFVFAVIGFAIQIFITYLFFSCARSIPAEHRQVEPGLAWTLLIPCVNIVMVFIVLPKIAAGFQSYFASQNRPDVGDCGAKLALYFGICLVAGILFFWLPPVAGLIHLASLVLLIMLLVKFTGLKGQIPA